VRVIGRPGPLGAQELGAALAEHGGVLQHAAVGDGECWLRQLAGLGIRVPKGDVGRDGLVVVVGADDELRPLLVHEIEADEHAGAV
jgi:hypothetical protein